jgi:hypothetical protein
MTANGVAFHVGVNANSTGATAQRADCPPQKCLSIFFRVFCVFRVQKHLKRNPEILQNRYYLFVNRELYWEHYSKYFKKLECGR